MRDVDVDEVPTICVLSGVGEFVVVGPDRDGSERRVANQRRDGSTRLRI
jgi:hypothetical protein